MDIKNVAIHSSVTTKKSLHEVLEFSHFFNKRRIMNFLINKFAFTISAGILIASNYLYADVEPADMFGDNMVLQREMLVPVWGRAEVGETVTVQFAEQSKSCKTGKNGKWMLKLDPLVASAKGAELIISGKNKITFNDVLVGEVWICCGQSNMQLGWGRVPEIKALINETSRFPIRSFTIPGKIAFTPQEESGGKWVKKNSNSAVGGGFASYLYKSLKVPIAIINTYWGSSSIEGWMPIELTEKLPHFKQIMDDFNNDEEQLSVCKMLIKQYNEKGCMDKRWGDSFKNKKIRKEYKKPDIFARTRPNMLYNAKLHPIIPFAVRGMVWYQGEANANKPQEYAKSLPCWVKQLRKLWNNDDFYFLGVMLPGYAKRCDQEDPNIKSWSWMREAQMKVLELPNTAISNTIDLGDKKNIHPLDKEPIAKRLSLLARRNIHGEKIVAQGPKFKEFRVDGSTVVIKFDNAAGLKTKDNEAPKAFWLAGKDQAWHRAEATISGDTVSVESKEVSIPVACRYAFAGMPKNNLVNGAGLPALPFRTDNWICP